ncbi:Maf family nucleotide pyrophosphatase [Negadavirga shengliensis]|uniref:dTTP/UTP pyrophosphatase n=1 Tax=Negadavirga shengliensis TaxID=1389218 RepID=A0ABV9T678_9BACT
MILTKHKNIILASKSPRRQELLTGLGLKYTVKTMHTDEHYPEDMPCGKIASYLAEKKADALKHLIGPEDILITADTVVIVDGKILNKPADHHEAKRMLRQLSSKKHEVMTGVCLMDAFKKNVFDDITDVYFNHLEEEEIDYYVENYKPMDKAGAYGIQEWIGYIGVEKIEGSYYNVMGLPVHKLYRFLKDML